MDKTLAGAVPEDTGTVRLDADGHLVITKLTAEDIPAEASAFPAGSRSLGRWTTTSSWRSLGSTDPTC